jgi:hypothetical protein
MGRCLDSSYSERGCPSGAGSWTTLLLLLLLLLLLPRGRQGST